jgi:putative lipoprotein
VRIVGIIAAALGLTLAAPARGEVSDPWLGRDKALHFGLSATLAAGGYAGGAIVFDERWAPWAAGAGLALGAGVAKELWDLSGHGTPSLRDLTWDTAGTAVGLLTAWAFDRLVVRRLTCSPAPLAHEPE